MQNWTNFCSLIAVQSITDIQPTSFLIPSPPSPSSAVISFHRLINRTLLGVRIFQSAFFQQTFQVAGGGGRGKTTKLLETLTGNVLVDFKKATRLFRKYPIRRNGACEQYG